MEPEPLGGVPPDDSPITPMCEVTGGRRARLADVVWDVCFCRVHRLKRHQFLKVSALVIKESHKQLHDVLEEHHQA